jgi:O-acetyl-ADP-ribose deacetylase (regulator of RNase III)
MKPLEPVTAIFTTTLSLSPEVLALSSHVLSPEDTAHVQRYDSHAMTRILLQQGDITTQRADAIVNAANSSLMGGGGVDGAIHRKGGRAIIEECRRLRATTLPRGLPPGHAVATTAGELNARWVIHTVGPVYSKNEDRSHVLASCHTESLRIAAELGARTVVFPAISTGVYGYPLDEAAVVAVRAVRDSADRLGHAHIDEIRFVLFDEQAFGAFERALGGIEARTSETP